MSLFRKIAAVCLISCLILSTSVTAMAAGNTIGYVATDVLNVRSGPGTGYSRVGQLGYGTNVSIIETTGEWHRINWNGGTTAYVNLNYIGLGYAPQASGKGNQVVEIAKKYIGTPYVYGGDAPGGFDCSGFTSYVFGKMGIYLPHRASEQANLGTRVSKQNLQVGDLVFFTNGGSGIGHVGIYVGNHSFIHSPRTGKTVCIQDMNTSYYTSHYVTATRILN